MKKWLTIATLLAGCSGTRPEGIGSLESIKKQCPESPNCISSFHPNDQDHYQDPMKGVDQSQFNLIKDIIKKRDNAKVIKESDNYIYAEFTSSIMKFVDDVEFSYDESDQEIHFRSASRLGKSDLGVNKKRINSILEDFKKN